MHVIIVRALHLHSRCVAARTFTTNPTWVGVINRSNVAVRYVCAKSAPVLPPALITVLHVFLLCNDSVAGAMQGRLTVVSICARKMKVFANWSSAIIAKRSNYCLSTDVCRLQIVLRVFAVHSAASGHAWLTTHRTRHTSHLPCSIARTYSADGFFSISATANAGCKQQAYNVGGLSGLLPRLCVPLNFAVSVCGPRWLATPPAQLRRRASRPCARCAVMTRARTGGISKGRGRRGQSDDVQLRAAVSEATVIRVAAAAALIHRLAISSPILTANVCRSSLRSVVWGLSSAAVFTQVGAWQTTLGKRGRGVGSAITPAQDADVDHETNTH
jgi:hypothetical protein